MARTVIVGDIHGCYQELLQLLDVARVRDEDVLISVGDVVDRGPEPLAVIDFFRSRPHARVLMGNHERKHVREVFSYAQQITRLQLGERYAECVAWMKTLPYFHEDAAVRVVHAAMVPGLPLTEQDEEILAGTTSGERKLAAMFPDGYWHERYADAPPIVFGHHVVGPDPLVTPNRVYGIDTGACHGMRLTALSVPDLTLFSVDARADHWAHAKAAWQRPVLQAKPWLTMSWTDFASELDRFERATGEARAYLDELAAWADQLRARADDMLAAARVLGDRLLAEAGPDAFTAVAKAHPAAALLFQARSGRLDRAALARVCSTPRKTYELAHQLGLTDVPAPP